MAITDNNKGFIGKVNDYYRTAYDLNQSLKIASYPNIMTLKQNDEHSRYQFSSGEIIVTTPDGQNVSINSFNTTVGDSVPTENFSYQLNQLGDYKIRYTGRNYYYSDGGYSAFSNYSFYFLIAVVENHLPLKKWTVTEVINRLLDLAEPIRKGEKARFRLNGMRADGTIITPDNKQEGEVVGQAYQFDKILAPEFSFTKQTLRECLQEVGKFVHGEPRLKPVQNYSLVGNEFFDEGRCDIDANNPDPYEEGKTYFTVINGVKRTVTLNTEPDGSYPNYYLAIPKSPHYTGNADVCLQDSDLPWYYEITYDMYASQENGNVWFMPYTTKSCQHTIENYASYLDSNAENLVNKLDKYSGVIVEPYAGGAKSVRTENQYVRIEDGNMIIATQYPIYSVEKLEFIYNDDPLGGIGGAGKISSVDITPWLFEKSIYDTQLTSYTEAYPYSKAYGIYYTQGAKNIGGLNFKLDGAVFAAFKSYAIVNILKKAKENLPTLAYLPYPTMSFRVTYTPIYNARVAQTKSFIKDFKRPAALIFNQQSNVIESRYYGENLKGAIARLGNIEASLTYYVTSLKQIPKAGQKFNKDYYISVVSVELLPTVVKFTIGLSKDFNRLSQYIGISSSKRFYEVSQNQAVERNVLYREYMVVGDKETADSDSLIGLSLLTFIAYTIQSPVINESRVSLGPVTNVIAWGKSYNGNIINNAAVNLPVISSAFGNSISFSWRYEDNYSAGATSERITGAFNDGAVSGYFQNDCKYTDYYGRLYYYDFTLCVGSPELKTPSDLTVISQRLPAESVPSADEEGIVTTIGKQPFIMRKDNREALQVNFQIDFVTNRENMIIGSALASYSPAVRGTADNNGAKLYVFPTDLNKFTDHIEAYEDVDLSELPSAEVTVIINGFEGYITVDAEGFPASGKSWAIVTEQTQSTIDVEGEDGQPTTQTQYFGGDLLIGENMDVTEGQPFPTVYLTKKREIFDKSVWKDRR